MLEVLRASGPEGVQRCFFTRKGGVSEGNFASLNCNVSSNDNKAAILENRRRVAEYLNIAVENLLNLTQVHSPKVVTVEEPWGAFQNPEADAMVTARRGIALGIHTADCAPLLLADAKAGVIGAAHAGWRGALGGVVENTVAAMQKLGAVRKNVSVALGPCIGRNSYEVSLDFMAPFLAERAENQRFFMSALREGHATFDLPGYVMEKLRALGIFDIDPPPADTLADETRFFSYRRACLRGEGKTGSLISAIMLAS